MARTVTFDLPLGYEDSNGTVHKTIAMRRQTPRDRIEVFQDPQIRKLAQEGHKVSLDGLKLNRSGAVQSDDDGNISFKGEVDALGMFAVSGATSILNAKLLGRLVLKLGTIDKPGEEMLKDLDEVDFNFLVQRFEAMSNEDASAAGGAKAAPLPVSEPSAN